MVFCRYCAKELHETTSICAQCRGGQNIHPVRQTGSRRLWLAVIALVLTVTCLLTLFDDRPVTTDSIVSQAMFAVPALVLALISLGTRSAGKKMATASVILAPLALALTALDYRVLPHPAPHWTAPARALQATRPPAIGHDA